MDEGSCDADDGSEVSFGLLASEGDCLEFFDFDEEVFDEMTPLIHDLIDEKRLQALRSLGNDRFRAALVHFFDQSTRIERLVRQ